MSESHNIELQIIIEACKVTLSKASNKPLQKLLAQVVNWDVLFQQTAFHVLYPLLYIALKPLDAKPMPAQHWLALKNNYQELQLHNLHKTKVTVQILELFKQQGVKAIPHKGINFAFAYYGDISLRHTSDVDILIEEADVLLAAKLLEEQIGCQLEDGFKEELTHRNNKILTELNYLYFQNGQVMFYVDLHLNTAQSWFLASLTYKDLQQYIETGKLLGKTIERLNVNGDLLTLTIHHGRKERWDTLKYVVDLYAMLTKCDGKIDWPQLTKALKKHSLEGELIEGLALSNRLLGLPAGAKKWLSQNQKLVDKKSQWYNNKIKDYVNMRKPNRSKKHLRWLWEKRSISLWVKSIAQALHPTANETSLFSLPKSLYFVYYIIRPFNLIYRALNRKV